MMSSATSSNSRKARRNAPPQTRPSGTSASRGADRQKASRPAPARGEPRGLDLQPVHLLILGTVAAASAAALMAHGTRPANIVFVVLAVLAAGVVATAVFRTLWPLASEVAAEQSEMVGGRTRAALEREKTIVLRAIKELEFDRAMGKVSAADCEEMVGRLRARAVRLIRQLDAGSAGYRDLIDRELNARLGTPAAARSANGRDAAGRAAEPRDIPRPDFEGGNGKAAADPGVAPARAGGPGPESSMLANACLACGAMNDPDARFCKACGTKLGAPA